MAILSVCQVDRAKNAEAGSNLSQPLCSLHVFSSWSFSEVFIWNKSYFQSLSNKNRRNLFLETSILQVWTSLRLDSMKASHASFFIVFFYVLNFLFCCLNIHFSSKHMFKELVWCMHHCDCEFCRPKSRNNSSKRYGCGEIDRSWHAQGAQLNYTFHPFLLFTFLLQYKL